MGSLTDRIRAAWRAFMGSTALQERPIPAPGTRIRVSAAAMWEAGRNNVAAVGVEAFDRPAPPAGVLPPGMALDQLPAVDMVQAYALAQAFHEGIGFLGYPYLAELSQRAEYRRMVSIWAEHCVRKWIKITGDDGRVAKIWAELERLNARDRFRQAVEMDGFFGRAQLFLDFGDYRDDAELQTPLAMRPEKISPKRPLVRLTPVEPLWSYPGIYDSNNPLAPDFYRPREWYVMGRSVHASRLLTMVGNPAPTMLKPAYAFGGPSMTQLAKPYVDNWLRTRQSVSDLVHSFSVMVLKTDMDQVLQGSADAAVDLFRRVDLFNQTRDNRGTFVLDKNTEDFTNVAAPISGLDKLLSQSQEQMSSVTGIPLVVLLGITPSGLNASSEGEIRVFYDAILAYCSRVLRPGIKTLIDVVQLSLFGEIDPDIAFEFESLWEMSDKDKADIRRSDAEADAAYIDRGVVSPEETRERLRDDETSLYHGVDLSGPAPEDPAIDLDENDDENRFEDAAE